MSGTVRRWAAPLAAGLAVYLVILVLLTLLLVELAAETFLGMSGLLRSVVVLLVSTIAAGGAGAIAAVIDPDDPPDSRRRWIVVLAWPAVMGVIGLFEGPAAGEPAWSSPLVLVLGVAAAALAARVVGGPSRPTVAGRTR